MSAPSNPFEGVKAQAGEAARVKYETILEDVAEVSADAAKASAVPVDPVREISSEEDFFMPLGSSVANNRVDHIKLGLNLAAIPDLKIILRYFNNFSSNENNRIVKQEAVTVSDKCIDINASGPSGLFGTTRDIQYSDGRKRAYFCKDGNHYFITTVEADSIGTVKLKIYDSLHKDHPMANISERLKGKISDRLEITEFRPLTPIMPESENVQDSIIFAANMAADLIFGQDIDKNDNNSYGVKLVKEKNLEERGRFALYGTLVGMKYDMLGLSSEFLAEIIQHDELAETSDGKKHNYIFEQIKETNKKYKTEVAKGLNTRGGKVPIGSSVDSMAAFGGSGGDSLPAIKKGVVWRDEAIDGKAVGSEKVVLGRGGTRGEFARERLDRVDESTIVAASNAAKNVQTAAPRKSTLPRLKSSSAVRFGEAVETSEVAASATAHAPMPPVGRSVSTSASPRVVRLKETVGKNEVKDNSPDNGGR